jgi:glycosyltransferase involved in cell wall biosynthesis
VNSPQPVISVVMPVYNGQLFLKEAIDSILNQTYQNFELLVYNDGSTDKTEEILLKYEKQDRRVIFFNDKNNKGYGRRLNEGLKKAKGKYIARMDHDDISLPDRFEQQLSFMEENPEVIVCGSFYEELGTGRVVNLPENDEDIKLKLLAITPFCHPSVMFRAEIFKKYNLCYSTDHMPAEDHALWVDLASYGAYFNLSIPLFQYRIHESNISGKERSDFQKLKLEEKQKEYINWYFKPLDLSLDDIELLHKMFFLKRACVEKELKLMGELIDRILQKADMVNVSRSKLYSFLLEKYFYRCTTSTSIGLKACSYANKYFTSISPQNNIKLLIKSIFRYKPSEY